MTTVRTGSLRSVGRAIGSGTRLGRWRWKTRSGAGELSAGAQRHHQAADNGDPRAERWRAEANDDPHLTAAWFKVERDRVA
jgi:hypothetical protein